MANNVQAYVALELVRQIKAILNTEEDGDALLDIVRKAHNAEFLVASYIKSRNEGLSITDSAKRTVEGEAL
jgi:hypothetical protein